VDAVANAREQHSGLIFELTKRICDRMTARPAFDEAVELPAKVAKFLTEHPRHQRRGAMVRFDHLRVENLRLHREMGAQDSCQPR
jgi:hypothetical protein